VEAVGVVEHQGHDHDRHDDGDLHQTTLRAREGKVMAGIRVRTP
jgi:hypothetical protein